MASSTKRERGRRIDRIEGELAEHEEAAADADRWSVEWREAAPGERPDGVDVDAENRVIYYDAWSSQREVLDALGVGPDLNAPDTDIVALLGGYGTGKTVIGARWTITLALRYPGSRFLANGVTYSEARSSTYHALFEALPGERTATLTSNFNGPEESPIVADYNRKEHRLTLTNDSVIQLGSADKWSRVAGDEFGGIWMDEPSHYSVDLHDLLEMAGSRFRGVEGPKLQFWSLTGNGYNDAWEVLEKRRTAEGEELGHNIEVIRASTPNNPYLSEGETASFERQYAGTAREEQALHGGFAAAQGLVYSIFSRDTHVIPAAEARNRVDEMDEWRMYGYDAGWRDPRVLVEIAKTLHGQFVALDEYCESGAHVEDAIAWLDENEKPRGTIYAEHEPSDIQKFKRANWPVQKAEKSLDAGISEVRKRFETDEDDRPGLLVSERCENLIQELLGYKEEQVGTSAAVDHCCDGLRYAVHTSANSGSVVRRRRGGSAGKHSQQHGERSTLNVKRRRSSPLTTTMKPVGKTFEDVKDP